MKLLECVPNVSEGRDPVVIRVLADAVETAGGDLRDVHSDVDHHRSVFTFIGPPDVVERAALAFGRVAVERIDLRKHAGVHPRIGALDVMPFVPLGESTMADAIHSAHQVGRTFFNVTRVPVFFYGEGAIVPGHRRLPALRAGGFEKLPERLTDPVWRPDVGPPTSHPSAGVAAFGARGPLIALNALLATADVALADAIARALRESSGGLPVVQAMGVLLRSRNLAQVSMNLLDYRRTSIGTVARRLAEESERRSVRLIDYELVGCAPADAFDDAPDLPIAGLKPAQLLDRTLFPRPA